MKKRKALPTKHKFKLNSNVRFTFAGSDRIGKLIELTKEENGHATYTVKACGIIYPCLGLVNSKEVGNVIGKIDN